MTPMSVSPEIRVLDHDQEVAAEAADLFVWLGEQAIRTRANEAEAGRFRVALSGGSTPRLLYQTLAGSPYAKRLDWERVEFYFGDERCVPPDHPDSNFRLAEETLFRQLNIPTERIFRMQGEAEEPERAARDYEALLRKQFSAPAPQWPRFDLILLGLGDDGHIASLFPQSPALEEKTRAVVATWAPQGVRERLTVTLPVINQAQTIVFVVTGARKAAAVRTVLEDQNAIPARYPAKLVQPVGGRLIWFLDRHAAAELRVTKQQVPPEEE